MNVYIIDGSHINLSPSTANIMPSITTFKIPKFNKKVVRYILLIFEHSNILDGQTYLIGFGLNTEVNRKMITKHSIEILLHFLIKLIDKLRHNLKYTVNTGSFSDSDVIENIKLKHGLLGKIKNEYMLYLDGNLINDFLDAYYGHYKK